MNLYAHMQLKPMTPTEVAGHAFRTNSGSGGQVPAVSTPPVQDLFQQALSARGFTAYANEMPTNYASAFSGLGRAGHLNRARGKNYVSRRGLRGLGFFGALGATGTILPGLTFANNSDGESEFIHGTDINPYGNWPAMATDLLTNLQMALADSSNPWVASQLPRLNALSNTVGTLQHCGGYPGDLSCCDMKCRADAHNKAYQTAMQNLENALVTFSNSYQQQLNAATAANPASTTFAVGGNVPLPTSTATPGSVLAAGASTGSSLFSQMSSGVQTTSTGAATGLGAGAAAPDETMKYVGILAGVAVVGGLGWFLLRRRRK